MDEDADALHPIVELLSRERPDDGRDDFEWAVPLLFWREDVDAKLDLLRDGWCVDDHFVRLNLDPERPARSLGECDSDIDKETERPVRDGGVGLGVIEGVNCAARL